MAGILARGGAISVYILDVMMSAPYVLLILERATAHFSMLVAWSKMLGTAVLSVFNTMVQPEDGFLMTPVTVTFLLAAGASGRP